MATFTVYCHGTGFNRIKGGQSDELVAWFHNHTIGVEATLSGSLVTAGNYLINDGPGHGGNGIAQPQNVNPMTGDERRNRPLKKRMNPFSSPSFKSHLVGDTGGKETLAKIRGNISGHGWDENVIRTVNILQDLQFEKNQAIDRVNLVGWSRGAVTCIRIAALMHQVFGTSIDCNIFAVDPVAGQNAGIKMMDTRILNANVKNYIAILAMHEMRSTFKPQDWSRLSVSPNTTSAIMLPMPGVHNAQVIASNPADSAHITRSLAYAFLNFLGTGLTEKPKPSLGSAVKMTEAYARLVLSLSEHKRYQTQNTFAGRGAAKGSFRRRKFATTSKMDTYTKGGKGGYWINEHHRACFKAAFPKAYNYIFETIGGGQPQLVSKIDSDLFRVLNNSPGGEIAQSLMAKELLVADMGYQIQSGSGLYLNSPRVSWPDQLPLHA
ncbi:hypothetical protein NHH03_09930 [Stieleria sp. TO1_6]|uniref:hypothetical protein n=1 Tax=Stieleria tagensis TaxID=2956795 RepID=UPI00209B904C|nr:hypothetical protein [Stieleria tagensis]MCO8122056.1 hypothetical protein [Stieleria tagensis]